MINNYLAVYIFFAFNISIVLLCLWRLESINPPKQTPANVSQKRLTNQKVRSQIIQNDSNNVGVISNTTIHKIYYGSIQSYGKPSPVVMIHRKLDDAVHKRFLQYPMFSCNEEELDSYDILDRRVEKPIYIYEGYFHSQITNEKIYSRNPNPKIGKDFYKPAADKFIRAFYETFRRINNKIFNKLKMDLYESANLRLKTNQNSYSDPCYVFAKWIERGLFFGDLSIQIHYGQGNDAKFKSGQAWHTDAVNSLLHFAITLRGERVLHSKRSVIELRDSKHKPIEYEDQQQPGDVYLSSSTLMLHAPKFPTTTYTERTIAIHARILYTTEEMNVLHTAESSSTIGWKVSSSTLIIALFI